MGIKSNYPAAYFYDVFSATGTDASDAPPHYSFGISASGGTETTYTDGTQKYKAHIFEASGSFVVSALSPNDPTYDEVEYLVVGGGGGAGGGGQSGGGGAGGLRTNVPGVVDATPSPLTISTPFPVSAATYLSLIHI